MRAALVQLCASDDPRENPAAAAAFGVQHDRAGGLDGVVEGEGGCEQLLRLIGSTASHEP